MALNIQDYYKKIANENPYALSTDTQAIRQAYDQATAAAHAAEERSIINAENAWQRNLASTQQTALDTIRKNNASAIATGASKGMQAANELSAILGLQDTATEEATALAQQRLDLADKYAAEYAKNAITAQETASANKQAMMSAAMQQYGYDTEYAAQELLAQADIEAAKYGVESAKWSNQATASLEYIAQYEKEIAALTEANKKEGITDATKAANTTRIGILQDRINKINLAISPENASTTPATNFANSLKTAGHAQIKPQEYGTTAGIDDVRDVDGNKIGQVVERVKDEDLIDALDKAGINSGRAVQHEGAYYVKGNGDWYWKISLYG